MSEITWDLNQLTEGPAWRGAVDGFTDEWIYGWVLSASEPQQPIELEISLFGEPVLTTVSTIFREDIAGLLKRPVRAGFSVPLRDMTQPAAQRLLDHLRKAGPGEARIADILRIEIRGTGLALPFSSNLAGIDRGLLQRIVTRRANGVPKREEDLLRQRGRLLESTLDNAPASAPVMVLAFYRSQFYPYALHDGWYGRDTTDWADVAAARPLFDGHAQPRLPGNGGFYDLRVDAVQQSQIAIAKDHGLSGFCYDYHWAAGQARMTLPIDRHVTQDYDFGFCLCWANEGRLRAPSGEDGETVSPHAHSYSDDNDFIRSCLKYFRSPRYISIDDAPLLLIRGISSLKSPPETIRRWREIMRNEGFPDLHVCIVETEPDMNPHDYGGDSSCQYPPVGLAATAGEQSEPGMAPGWQGDIQDYADAVQGEISRPAAGHMRFRTAMPGWDDTPRYGLRGTVFTGARPELFGLWMRHLAAEARDQLPEGQRFVFVRSWNDWASGACLEPDRQSGTQALTAMRDALTPKALALAPLRPPPDGQPDPLAETRRCVESLIAANRALDALVARRGRGFWGGDASVFVPVAAPLMKVERQTGQPTGIDMLNGHPVRTGTDLPVARWQGLAMRGWFLIGGRGAATAMIALRDTEAPERRYVAAIHNREDRPDVVAALSLDSGAKDCGFTLNASFKDVPAGRYEVEFLIPDPYRPKHALAVCPDIVLLVG
ncbi:glycoside hydrolase family 99-like domain-containing protein [Paracoccus onubensis]|uniref:glycosyltransferase WbsX family protein n=1 Tax=Paracoccus onubensis TaxID=1675788 RepID=UPI00273081B3|nr:glycoside hydrolase family 99-like domain-containing protein [Paracoccus onubensis]MDP0928016.1 glycoside hydrolase family 99-like domain-containing protein [Paracoccus onubensis]